jgi:twitching motility protein PilT
LSDITVLVVESDAEYVQKLKAAFEADPAGIQIVSAGSGPRALGIAAAQPPAAIIVDGELDGLDGYALTARLKEDPTLASIPVIIVSPSPTEALALKARQVGAAAHLPRSIDLAVIVEKVHTLVGVAIPAQVPVMQPIGAPVVTSGGNGQGDLPYGVPQSAHDVPRTAAAPVAPEPSLAASQPIETPAAPVAAEYAPPQPTPEPVPAEAPLLTVAPEPQVAEAPLYGAPPSSPAGYGIPEASGVKDREPTDEGLPHIDDLLRLLIERNGSDLHITVGSPPGIRQRGELTPLEDFRVLTPKDTMAMLLSLLSEEQRRKFETELELDFAYSLPGVSRFRANIFQQRNSMGAVFRVIPLRIPTLEELGLAKVCRYLADRPRGLVLVTGPTGSGKSTTLAAMIDHINSTRKLHIITIEDPIEFLHQNKMCYVNQREVGEDTRSFDTALKRVLRQDPDVILVGEMRDLETISTAITAAETGHLVLATLHTTGGPATIDRIIDVFPPHQQQQVRMQLSNSLEGVLSQVLLRSIDGKSRVMAMEVMLGIPAIRNLIREGKTHQMPTIIQGGSQLGMQTLDQSLKTLLQAGKITFEEAVSKAMNPKEFSEMMGRKM